MLKVNHSKTEFAVFSSKRHVMDTENIRIKIDPCHLKASRSVTHLRLLLRSTLGIEK